MRKVDRRARIATLYLSLWMATSHGKTVRSFGIRFSETCKGFQIMEDTNIKCVLCSTMCLVQLKLEERFRLESHGVLVHNNDTHCAQIRMETGQVFCFESDFVDEETMTLVDTDRITSVSQHKGGEEWHSFPPPAELHTTGAIGLVGNQLIIVGGKTTDGKRTNICERFDPPTGSWIMGPALPQALSHLTLVQASSNTIILVGGFSSKPENNNPIKKTQPHHSLRAWLYYGQSDQTSLRTFELHPLGWEKTVGLCVNNNELGWTKQPDELFSEK